MEATHSFETSVYNKPASATSQKTESFIVTAVKTSNPACVSYVISQRLIFFFPIHKSVNVIPSISDGSWSVKCIDKFCFNSCLLFYSNYPLHVSVVRPSLGGNIYIYISEIKITGKLGCLRLVACIRSGSGVSIMLISDVYISTWRWSYDRNM
jgi:hypothetical protein